MFALRARERALPRWSGHTHSTLRHMHRHKLWSSCDYVWRGQERRHHECRLLRGELLQQGGNRAGHSADAKEASANLISSRFSHYGNFYTTLLGSKLETHGILMFTGEKNTLQWMEWQSETLLIWHRQKISKQRIIEILFNIGPLLYKNSNRCTIKIHTKLKKFLQYSIWLPELGVLFLVLATTFFPLLSLLGSTQDASRPNKPAEI